MLIRLGYDIEFDVPAPLAYVAQLRVHPSRAARTRPTGKAAPGPIPPGRAPSRLDRRGVSRSAFSLRPVGVGACCLAAPRSAAGFGGTRFRGRKGCYLADLTAWRILLALGVTLAAFPALARRGRRQCPAWPQA